MKPWIAVTVTCCAGFEGDFVLEMITCFFVGDCGEYGGLPLALFFIRLDV